MFNFREKILQAYTHAEKETVKKERHSPFLKTVFQNQQELTARR